MLSILLLTCSALPLITAAPLRSSPTKILGTDPDKTKEPFSDVVPPSSCMQLLSGGTSESGQYTLNLGDNEGEFYVYCDMEAALLGGGWTVIQRRVPGEKEDYFNKEWKFYKNGFGTFTGSFWLGLEKIHRITSSDNYELYIGMENVFQEQSWAHYGTFRVGDEASKYSLLVSDFSGPAGDSLQDHSGNMFSAVVQDNDSATCAGQHTGGWWFDGCSDSNLNGRYYRGGVAAHRDGISWHHWGQPSISMTKVVMAIRPVPLQ